MKPEHPLLKLSRYHPARTRGPGAVMTMTSLYPPYGGFFVYTVTFAEAAVSGKLEE